MSDGYHATQPASRRGWCSAALHPLGCAVGLWELLPQRARTCLPPVALGTYPAPPELPLCRDAWPERSSGLWSTTAQHSPYPIVTVGICLAQWLASSRVQGLALNSHHPMKLRLYCFRPLQNICGRTEKWRKKWTSELHKWYHSLWGKDR